MAINTKITLRYFVEVDEGGRLGIRQFDTLEEVGRLIQKGIEGGVDIFKIRVERTAVNSVPKMD